jgi:hypothetical protein
MGARDVDLLLAAGVFLLQMRHSCPNVPIIFQFNFNDGEKIECEKRSDRHNKRICEFHLQICKIKTSFQIKLRSVCKFLFKNMTVCQLFSPHRCYSSGLFSRVPILDQCFVDAADCDTFVWHASTVQIVQVLLLSIWRLRWSEGWL